MQNGQGRCWAYKMLLADKRATVRATFRCREAFWGSYCSSDCAWGWGWVFGGHCWSDGMRCVTDH